MKTGREYWRSLEQIAETPRFREWLHREFPSGASVLENAASRRRMLQLMAASLGLAGMTACRRPVENILPASYGSDEIVPGVPLWYATTMTVGGYATGLLVESHDGRPTKIEGNPRHPASLGATSAYAQAAVLGLYDPDRSRTVLERGKPSGWEAFEAFAKEHFDPARMGNGARLRFLSETVGSPSIEALRAHALARFPAARWIEYEPLNQDEALAGTRAAFGEPAFAQYRFDRADVIVSLDHDFLGLDALSLAWIREFARRRGGDPQQAMNRLYAVETRFSATGAAADHRLRQRPAGIRRFAEELARRLRLLPGEPGQDRFAAALARDLEAHRGRSLVVAGPRQPAAVHALAALINQELGNAGATVLYTKPAPAAAEQVRQLQSLAAEMAAGEVETLVILGGNPAFTAPADMGLAERIRKVPTAIRLGTEEDETSAACRWHLPEAHFLEAWGDGRAADGTLSLQQPLIEPLYGGRSGIELVALLTGYKDRRGYDIVRNLWQSRWPAGQQETSWRRALHDGVAAAAASAGVAARADARRVAAFVEQSAPKAAGNGLEIAFHPGWAAWDGRFANNGWLQETPDPMTRLTWDNAALVSPKTAAELGLKTGDLVTLSLAGREAAAPVLIQPGHADGAVSVALGYGRRVCGRVGRNVGFNGFALRSTAALWSAPGLEIRKAGKSHRLAVTQDHHSMEGRPLILEATLEEYRKDPKFPSRQRPHEEPFSLYREPVYDKGHQWGMAIDLNACVGCNACAVACQAENNIPIVGKTEVLHGREMNWIRVDRYFSGPPEDPRAVVQPVTCQQCESAPCENVCPVAATTHSPEGLNDMAYNRCVGTRYCSNNCPYKVRRFNFLDFHKGTSEVEKMVFNPDVTVRMRGVMEKCTYCVQRIEEKKIQARREGRRALQDGEIRTACQQACPAGAIVFGDINDPASRVAALRKHGRGYRLLEELNTKPRTTYLARLRNPNPELA